MIKNENDRKRPASISLSANDKAAMRKAAKIMDRSISGMVMVLVRRFLERRETGLL